MGRESKKPELIVRRECTNERPLLDLFADAYRVYFDEKQAGQHEIVILYVRFICCYYQWWG